MRVRPVPHADSRGPRCGGRERGLLVRAKPRRQGILFSLFPSREIDCSLVCGEEPGDSSFLLIWLLAEWEFALLNV